MTFRQIKKVFFYRINTVSGRAGMIFTGLITTCIFFIIIFIILFRNASNDYEQVISRALPAEKLCGQIEVYLSKSVSALDNYLITGDLGFKAKREAIWNGHIPSAVNKLLHYTQQWENKNAVSYVYEIEIKASRIRAEEALIEKTYPAVLNMTYEKVGERKAEVNKLDILTEDMLLLLERLIQVKDEEISLARQAYISLMDRLIILCITGSFILILIGITATIKFKTFLNERMSLLVKNLSLIAKGTESSELEEVHDEFAEMHQTVNKIASEMHLLNNFLREAAAGNFNLHFKGFEEYGELGEAASSLQQKLRNFATETETHNWITEGISFFADILREKNTEIKELTEEVLMNLIKYLDASQGAIYLLRETNGKQYLELTAKYAYESLRYQEGKLVPGEGILGEAFKEKRQVYLAKVPKDYLHISSGLGEAEPHSLLIMPLASNGHANGIIELASFHEFKSYQIEFVKRVCESISSTILHTESAHNTKMLLKEANMNAEMMQTQEEEMRQNMEELLATQEELSRQKHENEAYMKAFKNNYSLEYDLNGEILDISKPLADLLKISPSDLVGKHINILLKGLDVTIVFQQLELHSLYTDQFIFEDTKGKKVPLKINFIPINKNGEQIKSVVCFCADISDEFKALNEVQAQKEMEKSEQELLINKLEERLEKVQRRSRHNEDVLLEKIRKLQDK